MPQSPETPEKRERILRAAVVAFGRRGFHRTRIRDIARDADVADGTVYLYFESKEALLTAIYEETASRFLAAGRERLAAGGSAVERLHILLEEHLADLGSDRDLATIFQIELRHTARVMGRYSRGPFHDYLELIDQILRAGQDEGSIRADLDTHLAARSIFGVLDEAVTDWVLSSRRGPLAEQAAPVLDLLLRGLAASA